MKSSIKNYHSSICIETDKRVRPATVFNVFGRLNKDKFESKFFIKIVKAGSLCPQIAVIFNEEFVFKVQIFAKKIEFHSYAEVWHPYFVHKFMEAITKTLGGSVGNSRWSQYHSAYGSKSGIQSWIDEARRRVDYWIQRSFSIPYEQNRNNPSTDYNIIPEELRNF